MVFNTTEFKQFMQQTGTVSGADAVFQSICEYVNNDESKLRDLTPEEIEVILVEKLETDTITTFNRRKEALKVVLKWFEHCGVINEYAEIMLNSISVKRVTELATKMFYFKDFDAVLEWLDNEVAPAFDIQPQDLLLHKTVFLLHYIVYDIDNKDIVNLKKSDCDDENYVVTINGSEYPVGEKYYNSIIKPYKTIDAITGITTNKTKRKTPLKETEYLIRLKDKKMATSTLNGLIKRLNDFLLQVGINKRIHLSNFKKIYTFNQIYDCISSVDSPSVFIRKFCKKQNYSETFIAEMTLKYESWKELYKQSL